MPDEDGNYTEEELKAMSPEELLALQKQNCIFCKIAAKEIPASEVYSDDKVVCVLDINPAAKGHVLVMPREHHAILPQVPPEVMAHLFLACQHISQAMLKGVQSEGTTVFVANGQVAGQRAPHFLMHVIPRNAGDGLFPGKAKTVAADQVAQVRKALALNLNRLLKGNQLAPAQRAPASVAAPPTEVPAPASAAPPADEPLADAPPAAASPPAERSAPTPSPRQDDPTKKDAEEDEEDAEGEEGPDDDVEDEGDDGLPAPPTPPGPSAVPQPPSPTPSPSPSPPAGRSGAKQDSAKADLDAITALFTGGRR